MNPRLRLAVATLAFGALAAPIAWGFLADARVLRTQQLIADMQVAEEQLSFRAVRTLTSWETGAPVTTLFKVSAAAGGRRRVEFAGVEGGEPPRRESRSLTAFHPLQFLVQLQRGLGAPGVGRHGGRQSRFGDPALVARNYRLDAIGVEDVAGRRAEHYALEPLHPGRPSCLLWVDAETNYLLRFRVLVAGAPSFEASHREIDFSAPPAEDTGSHRHHGRRRGPPFDFSREAIPADELEVATRFRTYLPRRIPAGFERVQIETFRARVPGLEQSIEAVNITYTDGVARLQILQFDGNNKLWKQFQAWWAGAAPAPAIPAVGGPLVVQRLAGPGGGAVRLNVMGTEIVIAGQVTPDELVETARSLMWTATEEDR